MRVAGVSRAGLIKAGTDLSLALLFALFAWAHGTAFLQHPRTSVALIVLTEALFAMFVLVRRDSGGTSRSAWDWLAAAVGSLAPLLVRPTQSASDLLVADAIQVAGAALQVVGVLSLNRSVGIVPAHRGVVTGGLYRLVRHPLYMAYTVTEIGYVMSNPSIRNGVVAVIAFAFQLARIANEERFLSRYPEYREYQARTRWRLLPYVY